MIKTHTWALEPDRCFDPEPTVRALARRLYETVRDLPLVCPHGHVPPALLADPAATLGTPADLFIIPDHYVVRMLYSQGVQMEDLGVRTRDGSPGEADHRRIWQRFAEHFHLFRATPTGLWLQAELVELFSVEEKPTAENAEGIYDSIVEQLATPEFTPRALFERFNIEVLATTDAATDTLDAHRAIQDEGKIRVVPTFRPDAVFNLEAPGWKADVERMGEQAGVEIVSYATFIRAVEVRRAFFKDMGATATDHSATSPYTHRLSGADADAIFGRALRGRLEPNDATAFMAHMLIETARMSAEDGLVMQLHVGSHRNHHSAVFERFGADSGSDMPVPTEWTRNLHELLNAYGADPRFRLILFTLDETTFSRELAPLAGHYPALLLGPPWWFYDSVLGMERYLDAVVETAGVFNTAGFNDDTRAFASIPARHDVWRRVACNWLARQTVRGLIDEEDALDTARYWAYDAARRAYRLDA
ncbi:MAG: glucuronate isomerase [Chloroflexia bacterium]